MTGDGAEPRDGPRPEMTADGVKEAASGEDDDGRRLTGVSEADRGEHQPIEPGSSGMYIGIGTIVLILVIILLVMMFRGRSV